VLEVCSGVTNEKEKGWVFKRSGQLRPEGLRSEFGGPAVVSYRSSESELEEVRPPVGGSASPFIDEGDGSIGERERVRMSLSLTAHADEDWIMVGAPNTVDVAVECQMRTGGRAIFFRKDGRRYLQILFDA